MPLVDIRIRMTEEQLREIDETAKQLTAKRGERVTRVSVIRALLNGSRMDRGRLLELIEEDRIRPGARFARKEDDHE